MKFPMDLDDLVKLESHYYDVDFLDTLSDFSDIKKGEWFKSSNLRRELLQTKYSGKLLVNKGGSVVIFDLYFN